MFKSYLICNLMLNFYFNINNLRKRERNASIQSIFQKYIFQLCLLYMRYNAHVYIYICASLSISLSTYIYIYIYIYLDLYIYAYIYIYIYIYAYMYLYVGVCVCVCVCVSLKKIFANSFCLGTGEGIRYQLHLNMIA